MSDEICYLLSFVFADSFAWLACNLKYCTKMSRQFLIRCDGRFAITQNSPCKIVKLLLFAGIFHRHLFWDRLEVLPLRYRQGVKMAKKYCFHRSLSQFPSQIAPWFCSNCPRLPPTEGCSFPLSYPGATPVQGEGFSIFEMISRTRWFHC